MKKSFKRTVSLFLCLAMVFCIPAFAAEEDVLDEAVLDEHDGHDCAEHEVVGDTGSNDTAYPSDSVDGSIMAMSDCIHGKFTYERYNPQETRASHIVYLPGGNPVTCWYTNSTVKIDKICGYCGARVEIITQTTEKDHNISH